MDFVNHHGHSGSIWLRKWSSVICLNLSLIRASLLEKRSFASATLTISSFGLRMKLIFIILPCNCVTLVLIWSKKMMLLDFLVCVWSVILPPVCSR